MTDHDSSPPSTPPSRRSAPAQAPKVGLRLDRRAALKNIGALAGSAPAVTLLLTPSSARARGYGGSPCEDDRHSHCHPGRGHGGDRPGNGFGWGHEPGHGGWGHGTGRDWGRDRGRDWAHDRGRANPKSPARER